MKADSTSSVTISNPSASLHASIDTAGGRLTHFSSLNRQHCEVLKSKGIQYGSTVWPSPQADWGWPPPSALDSDDYMQNSADTDSARLSSHICQQTYWSLDKQYAISQNSLKLDYRITNEHPNARDVAVWEISRHYAYPVFFQAKTISINGEVAPDTVLQDSHGLTLYRYQRQLAQQKDAHAAGHKLFAHGSSGFLMQILPDVIFVKRFSAITEEQAARGEAGIEIYGHGDPNEPYIELEHQNECALLAPGDHHQLNSVWNLVFPADIENIYARSVAIEQAADLTSLFDEIKRAVVQLGN